MQNYVIDGCLGKECGILSVFFLKTRTCTLMMVLNRVLDYFFISERQNRHIVTVLQLFHDFSCKEPYATFERAHYRPNVQ